MAILKKSLTKSFGKEIKKRVHIKVVVWLDVKPASILQHPNVVVRSAMKVRVRSTMRAFNGLVGLFHS